MANSNRLQEVAEFQLVGEDEAAAPAKPAPAVEKQLTGLLLMSLRALSQRALVALSTLFTLALAASAFWLWGRILAAPSATQLVGVGMYAVFVLALEFVRRR